MPVNPKRAVLLAFLSLTACVTPTGVATPIELSPTATSLKGWISTRGEWTLFPTARFGTYSPYRVTEAQKCVSLVNDTGEPRASYASLQAHRVRVIGFVRGYDELANAEDPAERLLSKKYYKKELVENSCLREFVFIVQRVEPL